MWRNSGKLTRTDPFLLFTSIPTGYHNATMVLKRLFIDFSSKYLSRPDISVLSREAQLSEAQQSILVSRAGLAYSV